MSRELYRKEIKKIRKYIREFERLSDQELCAKTDEFKERIAKGATTNQLMAEAFAVVCLADQRVLGMMPFDVQIAGAIALHKGILAEMYTGEGKTLTATLPLYLNALTGKSTILVTANEYLACRDAKEMGQVYEFLGLTCMACVPENSTIHFDGDEKRVRYAADIVYTTHAALGFDYLFENLVSKREDRFMREFYYVIIDEADMVLLDAAQMPLVISGAPKVQSNLYEIADFFVSTLEEDEDYELKDKTVWLTEKGAKYAENFFGIDNFYSEKNFEINRHVTLALRARTLFEVQKDYMISDKQEVMLLDSGTGRGLPGMKLRGGQHQALETKEHVKISQEQRSVASITFQNLFLMFPRMAGMSGTIYDARKELRSVYKKRVVRIPTNRPRIRKDLKDQFFMTAEEQYDAVIKDVRGRHEKGQPVLVITSTIQDTMIISSMLLEEKIPHSVLNANNAFWEAEIIRESGRIGAVTVSTGIAGRGTDIKLREGVKELGGLAVVGVGRMANTRQEGQARGRSGRQGDPGTSQFYVSLEDDIVKVQYEKMLEKLEEKHKHLSQRKLKRLINGAQKIQSDNMTAGRERAVKFDSILKRQRTILYEARNRLLDYGEIRQDIMEEIIRWNNRAFVKEHRKVTGPILNRYILDNISYVLDYDWNKKKFPGGRSLAADLDRYAMKVYKDKLGSLKNEAAAQEFLRLCVLNALNDAWIEEVDYLQQLQYATSARSTAQRNPLFEYSEESYRAFQDMEVSMRKNIMRNVFLGAVEYNKLGEMSIVFP